MWLRFVYYFGLKPGIVRPMKLERWMVDKSPVWQWIAERHGLRYPDIVDVALWPYGYFVWNIGWVGAEICQRGSGPVGLPRGV